MRTAPCTGADQSLYTSLRPIRLSRIGRHVQGHPLVQTLELALGLAQTGRYFRIFVQCRSPAWSRLVLQSWTDEKPSVDPAQEALTRYADLVSLRCRVVFSIATSLGGSSGHLGVVLVRQQEALEPSSICENRSADKTNPPKIG